MADGKKRSNSPLYLGVDIGGTKIQASLVQQSGLLRGSRKVETPRKSGAEAVLTALHAVMEAVLESRGKDFSDLTAIGIAVPGVTDPDEGRVVITPNMDLSDISLGPELESKYQVPVVLGNDCNLGTLGESWLGSAKRAKSAVGIFVGTGIGAGFVRGGKIWRGARESASEIGHIIMQIGGPECGCGNHGCLEALASRSAIERDLRAEVQSGRSTQLTEILQGDLYRIKSGALAKALESDDALVTQVLRRAAEVLGYACLTVRHLIDPEVIVLGGGVIEACHDFILPIVETIVAADQLPGAREGGQVLLSALADDAVVLGAVALASRHVGRNPFKGQYAINPKYPKLLQTEPGQIVVGNETHAKDVLIRVNGKVAKRTRKVDPESHDDTCVIGPRELKRLCRGGPEIVFLGSGQKGNIPLTDEGRHYLDHRAIQYEALPTPEIIEAYNQSTQRRAALIHIN